MYNINNVVEIKTFASGAIQAINMHSVINEFDIGQAKCCSFLNYIKVYCNSYTLDV